MTELATNTIGMDLGDKHSDICVLDGDGAVVEESRIRSTEAGMRGYFGLRTPMRVVMEVGAHSRWVSCLVAELGHEVIVANPRRVRLIAENDHKTDSTDAELLARLGRVDPKLLAPVTHRKEEAHTDLVKIRARATLVDARTKLVNSVRGLVKASGARMPSCSTGRFATLTESIPPALHDALLPVMECIAKLTEEIRAANKRIEKCAEESYPETAPLRQIPGVAALTALAFVLTLEDPTKFRRARSVGAFIGLTSRQRQSGGSDPQLRITKAGDRYLRKLLVQSANYILGPFGPDTELRRWGLRLVERGGKNAKKRATVAVARKLAVLMYRLWVDGEDYKPFPRQQPEQPAEQTELAA